MLILTRRSGETIRIGNDVSVTVLGITGQQARIGISAPESVAVHREEIHQRIQAEKALDDVGESMQIDDRVRMIVSEPAFMTVVIKISSVNDARALIGKLPFRGKAFGTDADVFGYSAGNLMEGVQCAQ